MRNSKPIDFLAVTAAVLAAAALYVFVFGSRPSFDRSLHASIGRSLAREALTLLPPGGQITLISRDTQAYPQPAIDLLVAAFEDEIRPKVSAFEIFPVQLDPLRPVEVPPGDFYELIRKAKTNHVIVSLMGPPALSLEQRAKLGVIKPKIVGLCTGNLAEAANLQDFFSQGLLHVAIINKPQGSAPQQTGSLDFNQLYTIVRGGMTTPTHGS